MQKHNFLQRVAIMLETPEAQDNEKDYIKMQQAKIDLDYGVDLVQDALELINAKLEQFCI